MICVVHFLFQKSMTSPVNTKSAVTKGAGCLSFISLMKTLSFFTKVVFVLLTSSDYGILNPIFFATLSIWWYWLFWIRFSLLFMFLFVILKYSQSGLDLVFLLQFFLWILKNVFRASSYLLLNSSKRSMIASQATCNFKIQLFSLTNLWKISCFAK